MTEEEAESMIVPLSIPTAVPRYYYRFMQPIQLSPSDLDSEERCQDLYKQVTSPNFSL